MKVPEVCASLQLVNYLTRFVDETFMAFISIGFMSEAFKVKFPEV